MTEVVVWTPRPKITLVLFQGGRGGGVKEREKNLRRRSFGGVGVDVLVGRGWVGVG